MVPRFYFGQANGGAGAVTRLRGSGGLPEFADNSHGGFAFRDDRVFGAELERLHLDPTRSNSLESISVVRSQVNCSENTSNYYSVLPEMHEEEVWMWVFRSR